MKNERIAEELLEWMAEMELEIEIELFLWKHTNPSLVESIEHLRKAIEHIQAICN